MGSKRVLLQGPLAAILLTELQSRSRFVDAFCGAGSVSWFVAEKTKTPVFATDLQQFAVELAAAVITRTKPFDGVQEWRRWKRRAESVIKESPIHKAAKDFEERDWASAPRSMADLARRISAEAETPLTRSYGGYYFSPMQALVLDSLRTSVPEDGLVRHSAIASVVSAASHCSASPGHTAQPFKPTTDGHRHLFEFWRRDPWRWAELTFLDLAPRRAQRVGASARRDVSELAAILEPTDLVFLDPPYSAVHYSRYYHVLESTARGTCGPVEGMGRYPPTLERPASDYSIKSKATIALEKLFKTIATRQASAVMTFPAEEATNGLSGTRVAELASGYFFVERHIVNGRFSTLGGRGKDSDRPARVPAYEVILTLRPRDPSPAC